jgi:hypothetical protein
LLKLKAELAKRAIIEQGRTAIDRTFEQWACEERVLVDRKTSQKMGDHGSTYQIILEDRGELDAIEVDGRIKIYVDSIYRRLILKTAETYSADGGAQKKAKPIPVNMIRARDERAQASRKRALERELAATAASKKRVPKRELAAAPFKKRVPERKRAVAPSKKRVLERELAAAPSIKRGRGQAKKQSELSTLPAE